MSIHALSWALRQDMSRSSEKFVLVCLCNYADEKGICYPSIAALERDTSQDRKTVISSLKSLCESGLLADTGRRVGATKGVIVYQVIGMPEACQTHYVYRVTNPETGEFYIGKRSCHGDAELDTYRGSGRWTRQMQAAGVSLLREVLGVFDTSEAALVDEQRLFRECDSNPLCMNDGLPSKMRTRNSTVLGTRSEIGTVPKIPSSSTVFPGKQSQISLEAVPKTGHRSIKEPSTEPKSEPSDTRAPEFLDFKIAYPSRAGDQGWRKALRAINARLADGYSWNQIIDGAKRYASYVRATDSEGTQFVKQACVFVGPDLHFLSDWTPPKNKSERRLDANINVMHQFLEGST